MKRSRHRLHLERKAHRRSGPASNSSHGTLGELRALQRRLLVRLYALDPDGADLLALPRGARNGALANIGARLIDLSKFMYRSDDEG